MEALGGRSHQKTKYRHSSPNSSREIYVLRSIADAVSREEKWSVHLTDRVHWAGSLSACKQGILYRNEPKRFMEV